MNITVFGSSKPRPGEHDYEQAYLLGRQIAEGGHTVLTGGYIGTMEAVSRGAAEAGGHVIGVTCEEIENWRSVGANPWVKEERRFPSLLERLGELVRGCDAAIALPGGPGTLVEISLYWNHLIIAALPPRPLILVGHGWSQVFNQFTHTMGNYLGSSDHNWLHFVETPSQALLLVNTSISKLH